MKTQTTIPFVLDELRLTLQAQGEHFDTAIARAVPVHLMVSVQRIDEDHDEITVTLDKIILRDMTIMLATCGDVDVMAGTDVIGFLKRTEVESIEENLVAQVAGE